MPKQSLYDTTKDNQTRRFKGLGTISRKKISKKDYTSSAFPKIKRTGRYGYKRVDYITGDFDIFRSASLRRRKKGADRKLLAKAAVANPAFTPAKNNKSHGVPDIFGGPNSTDNLINEEQDVNLRLHKRVENSMDRFRKDNFGSNPPPLQRWGSMKMHEEFNKKGESIRRTYWVHTEAGTGTERFDQYTVTPS